MSTWQRFVFGQIDTVRFSWIHAEILVLLSLHSACLGSALEQEADNVGRESPKDPDENEACSGSLWISLV